MVFIISGVILNERIDVLLVSVYLGPVDAGIYGVCGRLSYIIGFAIAAVNSLLGPQLASIFPQNNKQKFHQLALYGSWLSFLSSAFIGLILIVMSTIILSLFGEHFISGQQALVILVVSQIMIGAFGATGTITILYGGYRIALIAVATGLLLNLVLNATFIPVVGMTGAAIATLFAMLVSHAIIGIWCYRKSGLNTTITGSIQGFKSS